MCLFFLIKVVFNFNPRVKNNLNIESFEVFTLIKLVVKLLQ